MSFEASIPVEKLEVEYFLRSENHLENVTYELDEEGNAVIITGDNSYVLWVPFPTFVFTIREEQEQEYSKEKVISQRSFYLISEGPLSSFTGEQTRQIYFSLERPIVVASLELHHHDDAFELARLSSQPTNKTSAQFSSELCNTSAFCLVDIHLLHCSAWL